MDNAGRCDWRPCCREELLVLGAHVAPARQTDVEVEGVKHLNLLAADSSAAASAAGAWRARMLSK
ncbi:MAG: hypothetical protein ACKPKO_62240, partial [Candidatus Fonsibacter sp.]